MQSKKVLHVFIRPSMQKLQADEVSKTSSTPNSLIRPPNDTCYTFLEPTQEDLQSDVCHVTKVNDIKKSNLITWPILNPINLHNKDRHVKDHKKFIPKLYHTCPYDFSNKS